MSFPYIPVASPLHDAASLEAATGAYHRALQSIGGTPSPTPVPAAADTPFWFVLTGGVEGEVLRRLDAWHTAGGRGPVLIAAHPGHNSLPASLEILARVRQLGGQGRIHLLRAPDDADTLSAIARTAKALDANHRLASERIGQIGAPSDWLVASSQDADTVRRRFGAELVPITLDEVRAIMQREQATPPTSGELAPWNAATARTGVTEAAYAQAIALHRALKAVVAKYTLSALTVRCFDWVRQDGTTGCLALALLADSGISAGCEGDIPSILALRWLWHLTGRPAWMANPAALDPATGDLRLAHCTIPLGLVGSYAFKTHFESGLGLGIDGTLPKGPITLLRLGGADLGECWCAEGELLADTHEDGQCRTQARVRIAPDAAKTLLERPLGNHLVLVPGHLRPLIAEAASFLDARA